MPVYRHTLKRWRTCRKCQAYGDQKREYRQDQLRFDQRVAARQHDRRKQDQHAQEVMRSGSGIEPIADFACSVVARQRQRVRVLPERSNAAECDEAAGSV